MVIGRAAQARRTWSLARGWLVVAVLVVIIVRLPEWPLVVRVPAWLLLGLVTLFALLQVLVPTQHDPGRRAAATLEPDSLFAKGMRYTETPERADLLTIHPPHDTSFRPPDDPPPPESVAGFSVARLVPGGGGQPAGLSRSVDLRDDTGELRLAALGVLRGWAQRRPTLVRDQYTAWVLGVPSSGAGPDWIQPLVGHTHVVRSWQQPTFEQYDGELDAAEVERHDLARRAFAVIDRHVEATWEQHVFHQTGGASTVVMRDESGEGTTSPRVDPPWVWSIHHVGASVRLASHEVHLVTVTAGRELKVSVSKHWNGPVSALRDALLDQLAVELDFERGALPRGRYWGRGLRARPDLAQRRVSSTTDGAPMTDGASAPAGANGGGSHEVGSDWLTSLRNMGYRLQEVRAGRRRR